MLEREAGVILMALIDGLHAQHPILSQGDTRPPGEQFAQWLPGEQGRQLGLSAVIDLHRLTRDVQHSLNGVAKRDKIQAAADWERIDALAALDAAESAEESVDDPFPAPGAPGPVDADTSPRCRHCGLFIQRVPSGAGKGWRHTGTQFLGCGPDHATLGEP